MMRNMDTKAGHKLVETGALINFEVTKQDIQPTVDGENLHIKIDLQMVDENKKPTEEDVEWGAFGFIFVLAVLSFDAARPRGISDIDFEDKDQFTVADLFDCLEFAGGTLKFYADYIRGRCLKTGITVRKDGSVSIFTTNRGKTLVHWLDILKGKKMLQAVK